MTDVPTLERAQTGAAVPAAGRAEANCPGVFARLGQTLGAVVWRSVGPFLRPSPLVMIGLIVGHLLPMSGLTTGPSFCPFKVATGLPCPGCGLTRSAVSFLQGDLAGSVYYHPLGAIIVVGAVVVGLADLAVWWRSRRAGMGTASSAVVMERIFATPAPWVAIGALALVWAVRLPLYVLGVWTF